MDTRLSRGTGNQERWIRILRVQIREVDGLQFKLLTI